MIEGLAEGLAIVQRQRHNDNENQLLLFFAFRFFTILYNEEREIRSNHLLGPIFGISFIQFQKKKKS